MNKKNIIICIIVFALIILSSLLFYSKKHNAVKATVNMPTGSSTTCSINVKLSRSIDEFNVKDNKSVTAEVKPTEIIDKPMAEKEVFLTIDDGPSEHTTQFLKILNENNIKATFFVVGKMVEEYPDMIKAIKDSGMSIQNHSYSHDYKMYRTVDECFADFNKCDEVLKKTIGRKPTKFLRLPGGSDNQVSDRTTMSNIRKQFVSQEKYYIDWNVSSTDGASTLVPTNRIVEVVTNACANKKLAVVLMHDVNYKATTVEALPIEIKYLKEHGFVFRTFDDITPTEIKEMVRDKIANR